MRSMSFTEPSNLQLRFIGTFCALKVLPIKFTGREKHTKFEKKPKSLMTLLVASNFKRKIFFKLHRLRFS